MEFDPAQAIRHLRRKDKALAAVIKQAGPFDVQPRPLPSTFAALLRPIVFQQLSGKAASTIYGRLIKLFPKPSLPSAKRFLELSHEDLRAAGLSRPKILAATDLAERVVSRKLPSVKALRALSDAEVIETLTEVRGIGRWTVEMLLMFGFCRPDVMPSTDLGVRKGFALVYGGGDELPEPAEIEAHAEIWRPYRSVASWYMWRAVDMKQVPD